MGDGGVAVAATDGHTDKMLPSITVVMSRTEKKLTGGGVTCEQDFGMLPNPAWNPAEHEGRSISRGLRHVKTFSCLLLNTVLLLITLSETD